MHDNHLGIMLDCSRNGVMNVKTVKKYIDILQKIGYNTLMLYTEDTYEVDHQPYFGYLRGRYTQAELKEIDSYALEHGIELIPCIQTLAHLNAITRWSSYKDYIDIDDILLCGDERTYQLIEDIFCSLAKCFTSRTVHIGMDEAHMVGLGKYLDRNGFRNRFEILIEHLKKVCQIAKKYGFRPIMWDDMFFRLVRNGAYYTGDEVPEKWVTEQVPEELGLVYWDYYSKDRARYEKMIRDHDSFRNELWFAGGLVTWRGFAPKNRYTLDIIDAAVPAVKANHIKNVFFTVWGDNGKECSFFSVLPSLYYAAKKMQGIEDPEKIKAGFYDTFGITFDDFMLLNLPDATDDSPDKIANPEKYMFYNDCFCGVFDCIIPEGFEPRYVDCARKLQNLAGHEEFGYLFDCMAKLCVFLQLKYTIGVRTRKAYRSADKKALAELSVDYERMLMRLENFYQAFKKQWFTENKPHGFDVQDLRMGGLKQRIISCKERLDQYLRGEISVIEELEEDILPEYPTKDCSCTKWTSIASVNVI